MNAITHITESPIATFEHLVATSASRLESIRAAIAEADKVQPGLSADEEIAHRKANAAKVEELRLEEGVFAARLEHHKEGLATARKVVAEQAKAEAREAALSESAFALEKVAAARETYLAALHALRDLAKASAGRGVRFSMTPEIAGPIRGEIEQLGPIVSALREVEAI